MNIYDKRRLWDKKCNTFDKVYDKVMVYNREVIEHNSEVDEYISKLKAERKELMGRFRSEEHNNKHIASSVLSIQHRIEESHKATPIRLHPTNIYTTGMLTITPVIHEIKEVCHILHLPYWGFTSDLATLYRSLSYEDRLLSGIDYEFRGKVDEVILTKMGGD